MKSILRKIKQFIAKKLFSLICDIDQNVFSKNFQRYEYETAPFCGHHYSGYEGKLTKGDFHEGAGEYFVKPLAKVGIFLGYDSEEGYRLNLVKPTYILKVGGIMIETCYGKNCYTYKNMKRLQKELGKDKAKIFKNYA